MIKQDKIAFLKDSNFETIKGLIDHLDQRIEKNKFKNKGPQTLMDIQRIFIDFGRQVLVNVDSMQGKKVRF